MTQFYTSLGLMSGTSLDGVDAALLTTDGEAVRWTGPVLTLPYPDSLRARLRAALGGTGPREEVEAVEREMTLHHAQVALLLLASAGLTAEQVDLIGFHGHTLLHRPEQRQTWQIGDGALLARETGIAVINDFRSADVAAGGQGAPLVPVFHAGLARHMEHPLAVLNLGGVGNVTWIGENRAVMAFDTGPGNALIDDWALRHTGQPLDVNGALARVGTVDQDLVGQFAAHPYFTRPPAKSLDRDDFGAFAACLVDGLTPADGAATLTAFTAEAVALAQAHLPEPPKLWLVCGGGRRNPVLMGALRRRLSAPVQAVESVGWDGDALEAQAFAYLAVRSQRGLPLTFPETTGGPKPCGGGKFHPVAAE